MEGRLNVWKYVYIYIYVFTCLYDGPVEGRLYIYISDFREFCVQTGLWKDVCLLIYLGWRSSSFGTGVGSRCIYIYIYIYNVYTYTCMYIFYVYI